MVLPLLHFCDAVLLAYNEKYILVFILFLNIHTNVCIYLFTYIAKVKVYIT